MRITYLHQYFVTPDKPGGTRSYEMARRLVAMGHEVNLITSDQAREGAGVGWRVSDEAGIRVHWCAVPYDNSLGFFGRMKAFLAFAIKSARRAASTEADVIFASSTPLTIAIPAIYAARRRKIPYVFEVRDVWPAVPIALGVLKNPVLRWLARKLEHVAYHRAAHVVALAPGMGEEVQRTGYPAERITIIPNGCDNDIFGHGTGSAAPLAEDHRLWLGDAPLILFTGTLGAANGVESVAEIAAEMRAIDDGVRFAIVGQGREWPAIEARARSLGVLDANLRMIPAVPKRELPAWLSRADLCLALFAGPPILWKDSVQNKFFDALAAGKPIASNNNGWQNQIAEQHDVGFAFPPNDPAAAAVRLHRAVRDKAWLAGVRERASVLASGDFNRDTLAARLDAVLRAVVARPGAGV